MLCVIIPIFRFDYIHRFLRLHPIYALKPARLIDLFKTLLPSYFYVYPMPFILLAFLFPPTPLPVFLVYQLTFDIIALFFTLLSAFQLNNHGLDLKIKKEKKIPRAWK